MSVRLGRAFSIPLFLGTVLIYFSTGRPPPSGDTLPATYLPFSLLREGNFYLDQFPWLYDDIARRASPLVDGIPYYLRYRKGHYVSFYPPGAALLALPVYAVPVWAGVPATSPWVPMLEKLSAILITACSVLFLFWALRRVVAEGWALAITVVYAFGTSSFSVSSQALWTHGPSQFFVALALYFLVRGLEDEHYIPWAGFALAASIPVRETNALIALPLGLYILHRYHHILWKVALFALPPLAFFLAYNRIVFGSALQTGHMPLTVSGYLTHFTTPMREGLTGLVFGPSRGLFIYSPVLLLSLAGAYLAWKKGSLLLKYLSLAPLLILLLYSKFTFWYAGWTYGPRFFSDVAPILCFLMYPVCQRMERQRLFVWTFAALAMLSVGLHTLGAYWYDGSWDARPNVDLNQDRLWSWRDSPIPYYAKEAYLSIGKAIDRLRGSS